LLQEASSPSAEMQCWIVDPQLPQGIPFKGRIHLKDEQVHYSPPPT
jgi:hypothetical protein